MPSPSSPHARTDVVQMLQKMASSARTWAAKMPSPPPTTAKTATLPQELATLDRPRSLTPRLVSLGVDKPTADSISSAFTRAALRMKDAINIDLQRRRPVMEEQLQHALDRKFCSSLTFAYSSLYAQALHRWSTYILDDLVPRILRARTLHMEFGRCISAQRRKTFNQSAIPTLEKFFEQNAFPSRLEKHELAHKCGMEYRQIHVWFQNHRSRYRKEGKPLSKPCSPTLPKELEESVINAIMPEDGHDNIPVDDGRPVPLNNVPLVRRCTLDVPAPQHAYPSPYPPLCSYDPFPVDPNQRTFQLPWLRVPNVLDRRSSQLPDMSTLVHGMERLSIVDDLTLPPSSSAQTSMGTSPLLSYGIVTICSRAPHPALLRRRSTQGSSRRQRLSAACSLHVPPGLPSGRTPNQHLGGTKRVRVASSACPPSRSRRGLPRRLPANMPRPGVIGSHPYMSPLNISTSKSRPSRSVSAASSLSGSDHSDGGVDTPLSTPPLHPIAFSLEETPSSAVQDLPTIPCSGSTWSILDSFCWDQYTPRIDWEERQEACSVLVS
ncbi:hypothetical protein C8Q77DRAFT_1081936 [Trametes polyzona]|nr:hypothetical protein C8Q77DRAFT_1081936 [Trametes polyzona]